jgi:TonB family protein
MDHKTSNPETDSWVDDRMAKLEPAAEWNPDAGRALERLSERKPALNAPWMRVAMAATILGATALVLVTLPWQRLWTPEPVAAVAAQTQTVPAQKKLEEKPQETAPAAQQTAETEAPQQNPVTIAVTPPTEQQDNKVLLDLPDNEEDLLKYLQELSKVRAGAQAGITQPKLIHTVKAEYTPEAKQAKVQGTVEVVLTVKEDGTARFESFKKTLGYGLDESVRAAAEQWLFTPAMKDGKAVATMITISVGFSLR